MATKKFTEKRATARTAASEARINKAQAKFNKTGAIPTKGLSRRATSAVKKEMGRSGDLRKAARAIGKAARARRTTAKATGGHDL